VLHSGEDFYSAPAVSADGRLIAWVSWSLPDMPWVCSVLWTARVQADGSVFAAHCQLMPAKASVQQPVFDDDVLTVLSDHQGWWQPWQLSAGGDWQQLEDARADHASAPWQLGERHHQPIAGGGWARVLYRSGVGELWLCRRGGATPRRIATEYVDFRCLAVRGQQLLCIARSATRLDTVLSVDCESAEAEPLAGGEEPFPGMVLSLPEPFSVPSSGDVAEVVSGFLYPPIAASGDQGSAPLILIAHGGPTSTAYPLLNLQTQFWCHQGFAVAELNYRGSSGFGRAFRMALAGTWGDVDVADMERAARWLAAHRLIDPARIFIQGRSSGGYTALMAMVRGEVFAAGASQFGVSDPRRLREMTHRFESGYLDWLLGPPDERPENWQQRSPLIQADRIRRPMIFFQGQQDRVVVPEQTAAIVGALRGNGGSPEVCVYPDEGHGFRKQHNLADMLERLLGFYRKQAGDR
jgi:dipeptidyl aminopeptidase/acylaminoacyl peptidase